MAIQQLDLFGSSSESPKKEKGVFVDEKIKVRVKQPSHKKKLPQKTIQTPTKSATGKRGRKSNKEVYASLDEMQVPDDVTLQQKLYYSISEVASWFNTSISQIRFWENEFDILKPRKNKKGDRLFRLEDIKNLKLIYFLLRNKKLSIEGAKVYLKSNKQNAEHQQHLAESLFKFKQFLLELKANITS